MRVPTDARLRELAADEAPLARMIVDANGVVVMVNQKARQLFSLTPKDVGRELQDLEISYRPTELRSLIELAHGLQMECLVEVASEREVERALSVDSDLIGINNRDLRTFEVGLSVTERLRALIPDDRVVVALSGIHTREDSERMAKAGVHAILVGEALMTSTDVPGKMRELLI